MVPGPIDTRCTANNRATFILAKLLEILNVIQGSAQLLPQIVERLSRLQFSGLGS